ncbi:hypothetical protein ACFDTO_07120 [Microbacteriaceae bacterium 4G12]
MKSTLIRLTWDGLEHNFSMDPEWLPGLGFETVLTTSELAEYRGMHVRAIYDLRTDGRGPSGIRAAERTGTASQTCFAG